MGRTATAHFGFGVSIVDSGSLPWEYDPETDEQLDVEFEDFELERLTTWRRVPWVAPEVSPLGYDRWKANRAEFWRLNKELPVHTRLHDEESGASFVVIKASEVAVDWGDFADPSEAFASASEETLETWRSQIAEYCTALGIADLVDEPRWFLTATYG